MFNLKNHKSDYDSNDTHLLKSELKVLGIVYHNNKYRLTIGDEIILVPNIFDCALAIKEGINELKKHLFNSWNRLADICEKILKETNHNQGSIDNIIFLNAVKKSHILSSLFTELGVITRLIKSIRDRDISGIDDLDVQKFNSQYLHIRSLHHLIMYEIYRLKVIRHYSAITKTAQISGPWANLDLPMKERVWEWDDGEDEYFLNRQKSRREQVRYNPENATKSGFYYVWQDLSRDPYRFEDIRSDSPYKSRFSLLIP